MTMVATLPPRVFDALTPGIIEISDRVTDGCLCSSICRRPMRLISSVEQMVAHRLFILGGCWFRCLSLTPVEYSQYIVKT